VPFSFFALPDTFSTISRASGPVFMFCTPGHVFGGTVGVGSRFHVLCSQTRFSWYRGNRVTFGCFHLLDSFSVERRVSGPVFLFCTPELVSGGIEGLRSRFHILRSRTHFRRYRGRQVPFSSFARPDSFSVEPRALGPVFMVCTPGLLFGNTEGVGSCFHVLRDRTRFRWYRGRRVPFSCFPLLDIFLAVRRASGPVFMFCAPRHISRGIEGVGSCFHVLISRTRFRQYEGCRVSISCGALLYSFSAVPRASCSVFMFCTPGLIFGGTEGVGSRFHILRSWTHF
jgi:hypothetical protein